MGTTGLSAALPPSVARLSAAASEGRPLLRARCAPVLVAQAEEAHARKPHAMAAADASQATAGRLFQGVSRQEFGFKMLQSMGWSEGQARAATPGLRVRRLCAS